MAKKTHKVVVAGQYYTREGRNKVLSNYEESFELTPEQYPMALSIIQNDLLKVRLREIDPNSDTYRTCQYVSGRPPEPTEDDVFDDVDPDMDNMAAAEAEVDLETGELAAPEVPTPKVSKVKRKTSAKGRAGRAK